MQIQAVPKLSKDFKSGLEIDRHKNNFMSVSMIIKETVTKSTMSKSCDDIYRYEINLENIFKTKAKAFEETKDPIKKNDSFNHLISKLNEALNKYKSKGNNLFKEKKFDFALKQYKKAVDILKMVNKNGNLLSKTNIGLILNECLINISICYLFLNDFENVLIATDNVLSFGLYDMKCYILRSKAYLGMKIYSEALNCIKKALMIKPTGILFKELKNIENSLMSGSGLGHGSMNLNIENRIKSFKSRNNLHKIIKILLWNTLGFIQNHKFSISILALLILMELKKNISSQFIKNLNFMKFK